MEGSELRRFMRQVPSPVVIVTAAVGGERRGITIGSFTSVSLAPPLVSFNVGRAAMMYPVITSAERFAVHLPPADGGVLCNHFAQSGLSGDDQFAAVRWREGAGGVPLLEGMRGILHCRPAAVYEAGDSVLVVGEVVAVEGPGDGSDYGPPLLYYDRAYRTASAELPVESGSSSGTP